MPSVPERVQDGQRHNEFWADYPDIWDEPWGRVHRPFDSRAAMAPFVAHQKLEQEGVDYNWLLYGDDDTMWFMSAVVDLLRDYDADLPYFISGQLLLQQYDKCICIHLGVADLVLPTKWVKHSLLDA